MAVRMYWEVDVGGVIAPRAHALAYLLDELKIEPGEDGSISDRDYQRLVDRHKEKERAAGRGKERQ